MLKLIIHHEHQVTSLVTEDHKKKKKILNRQYECLNPIKHYFKIIVLKGFSIGICIWGKHDFSLRSNFYSSKSILFILIKSFS